MSKPNIVFVLTDDQGYGDLGCAGNPWLKTPNIDQFYAESVRMTNYHVGPTCAPTRAGLMTGHFANSTGVWHILLVAEVSCGQMSGPWLRRYRKMVTQRGSLESGTWVTAIHTDQRTGVLVK